MASVDVFTYIEPVHQQLLISHRSGIELCEEYKTEKESLGASREGPKLTVPYAGVEDCPRSRIKYNLLFVFIEPKTKTILPHRRLPTPPREGGGRQVADGLHSAPLLTAAAPLLLPPGIGSGLQATGTSGSGPQRRSRTTLGSGLVGRAGSLDWSGHAGPGTEGSGGRAPGANASRPHLGHHFLELALRHGHGGLRAAPSPQAEGQPRRGCPGRPTALNTE